MLGAISVAAACGALIGFLAFRFGVGGVYFAILTIAFAEFARIGFDHLTLIGGSAGYFLPVANYARNDIWNLRGSPTMFYYIMLALTVAALVGCQLMLKSRIGYYWQAIREDEQAARAVGINTFRCKMLAVVVSAGMTAIGGVLFAFYYNNLFPEQVFHISRSIEIILGPIIGGVGTLFGPIIGAFLLTGLSEIMQNMLSALGVDVPGAKQVFYGVCLLTVVVALPHGVWPWLAPARLGDPVPMSASVSASMRASMSALLEVQGISKRFRGVLAADGVSFSVAHGEIFAIIGPNGAGKTTLFSIIAGSLAPMPAQ